MSEQDSSHDIEIPLKDPSGSNSTWKQRNKIISIFSEVGDESLSRNSSGDDDMISVDTGISHKEEQQEVLARNETKAVNGLRIMVILVLASVAIAVSVTSYFFISNNETDDFETAFVDQASRVIDAFQINAKRRVGAIESFALSIISHAKYSNSTWPFVTVPDFERRGVATSELAEVMSMIMAPFVTDDTRDEWERYSVANQGWLQEGLQISNSNSRGDALAIPEEIYRVKGLVAATERGPGPYLPQWQIAPIVPVPALVNFNLLSHTGYQDSLNALLEAEVAVVGRSFDFSDPNDEATAGRRDVFNFFLENWQENENTFEDDPIADLHVPLYDDYPVETRKLVGLLTCVVYWRTYFVNILPENTNGITVVLKNTCDQEYTYQINGPAVKYVGPGDLHESQYDSFVVSTLEGAYLPQKDAAKRKIPGSCLYSIHVYPSEEFESDFITNKPAVYTAVLVFIFCFTSVVFLSYDCLVERRQRIVMDTAVASSAIVSSLFPKVVRDRLYNKDKKPKENSKSKKKGDLAGNNDPDSQKRRLQNFVSGDGTGEELITTNHTGGEDQAIQFKDKPIADLFENCTVLFADIAGFTAWSSGREPSDVFCLLETLYGAFDRIAKKRRVFKVETIGDCYLAVTGLPEPQEDHALIMSLFCHECMKRTRALMNNELKTIFGDEDAALLSMRFGLHSGPVTAGVLRGEKSRFQLFGDTVNTAARMESTGQRDKIQLSQETADLLFKAGKGTWVEERGGMVEAKGKGHLQTYWLRIRATKDMSQYQKNCQPDYGVEQPVSATSTTATARNDDSSLKRESSSMSPAPTEIEQHDNVGASTRSTEHSDTAGTPEDIQEEPQPMGTGTSESHVV